MKQNKYFSLKRFARLLRQDLLINKTIYLFTPIGLGIAIYAITYIIICTSNNAFFNHNEYIPLILIYLMAVGAIIGTSFPALSNQIKKVNYLLTPGSLLEKYMVQFVIRIVLFIPLALIIFWVGVHLAKTTVILFPPSNVVLAQIVDYHFLDLFANDYLKPVDITAIVLSIFSIATLLFTGCTYFDRFSLVKTLIAMGIIVFIVVCTFVILSHIFYPEQTHGFDIQLRAYTIWDNMYNIQLFLYLLGGLSWLFFLPLAYFKLKEKEV